MSFKFNREYAGGSVGGILRKTNTTNHGTSAPATVGEARQVDLLVFGYACKIFRDDDKAREIDQGKHLIPWMGDSSLKIDRYDVRGALCDLTPHEVPAGGYGNRLDYLNADEQRAEQLCEEERYLFLYNNEEEHYLQQEEDLKRLKQESGGGEYNQVTFEYGSETVDGSGGVTYVSNEDYRNSPTCEEAEQPFSLPKNFEVPATIQLPETMKQHAIIEKTARFIASQGVQMEILLKAKQSNNVQFEFLTLNSALNPYYKFMLEALKNGTYPVTIDSNTDSNDANANVSEAPAIPPETSKTVVTVPTIKYKPSANCAYTQLISKIKGVPLPAVLDESTNTSPANSPSTVVTPVLLQYNGTTYITAEEDDANTNTMLGLNSNSNSNSNFTTNSNTQDTSSMVQVLKNSSALALAQGYSSDSESETEQQQSKEEIKPKPILNFPIPTENLQNMIDKTATYVIKNGRKFEETLRTKSEERFTFLIPDNEFYPYYLYKVTGDPDAASKEKKTRKAAAVAAALLRKKGLNVDKTPAPVSFSIKAKEETATSLQPALSQETSDEDDDKQTDGTNGNQKSVTVPEHIQLAIKLVENQLVARNAQLAETTSNTSNRNTISRFDIDFVTAHNLKMIATHVKSTKSEIERNALYEQQQQCRQKELKKAEEKVKDKLAQIAREKLGGILSKEKQIQLERKRKAMEFLNQIKDTPPTTVNNKTTSGKNNTKSDNDASDASDTSVRSIPITSYGPDEKTDDEEDLLNVIVQGPPKPTKPLIVDKPIEQTKITTTVTVSDDDDDVEVVSETIVLPKQKKKHRTSSKMKKSSRKRSLTPEPYSPHKRKRKGSISSTLSNSSTDNDVEYTRKSKKHKVKKSKKSSKKKSKKSSRSRSHSSHRHRSKSQRRSRSSHRLTSIPNAQICADDSDHSSVSYHKRQGDKSPHKSTKRKDSKKKSER